ncbi:MAG: hypothetical protein HKN29_11390, partial [Rhodothermales bacterium]|nr:hypothetical protein [Rhodothermales bacterium]
MRTPQISSLPGRLLGFLLVSIVSMGFATNDAQAQQATYTVDVVAPSTVALIGEVIDVRVNILRDMPGFNAETVRADLSVSGGCSITDIKDPGGIGGTYASNSSDYFSWTFGGALSTKGADVEVTLNSATDCAMTATIGTITAVGGSPMTGTLGTGTGNFETVSPLFETGPFVCVGLDQTGLEDGADLDFEVSLYETAACLVTTTPLVTHDAGFDVATDDVTAVAGVDYTDADVTTSITAASAPTLVVPVDPTLDTMYGVDETFTFAVSNPSNARLGTRTSATGTIENDDLTKPTISVAQVSGPTPEGSDVEFEVLVDAADSEVDATFQYETLDGLTPTKIATDEASSRVDYRAESCAITAVMSPAGNPSCDVTLTPGTPVTIRVETIDDVLWELTEEMRLRVTGVDHAQVAPVDAIGEITSDEDRPTLTASSPLVDEGDAGDDIKLPFTISIDPLSDFTTEFDWETLDGTAFDETVVADPDYFAASGSVIFMPADGGLGSGTEEFIYIDVYEDNFFEEDGGSRLETMTLDILEGSISSNSGIDDAEFFVDGTGTIRDDDPLTDFADGPESYDVAGHYITSATYLGALVDPDEEPLNSPAADRDDTGDGQDDEDGVLAAATFIPGGTTAIDVEIGDGGYLNIWFDWDADGVFDQPDERIVSELVPAYTTQRYF